MELAGRRGTGVFQWTRAGWFGGQLGATLWLLVLGVGVFSQARSVGAVLIAAAAIPNLVGCALWRQRHTLAPYPAIQGLVAVCGASCLLAAVALSAMGTSFSSLGLPTWILLMYPGLMLLFHLRERSARTTAA